MIRVNLLGSPPPAPRRVGPLIRRREIAFGAALLFVAGAILFNRPFTAFRSAVPPPYLTPAVHPPSATPQPAAPTTPTPPTPVRPPAEQPSPLPHVFSITAVEISQGSEVLLVRVRVDPRARYRHVTMQGPPRLVVDFPNTRLVVPVAQAVQPVQDPRVRRVRVGQPEPDLARVVLDLESISGYSIAPGTDGIEIRVPHAP